MDSSMCWRLRHHIVSRTMNTKREAPSRVAGTPLSRGGTSLPLPLTQAL
jgi:hypothetical protein